MKYLLALIVITTALHSAEITLMSKSTIFGVFKMSFLTSTCYDKRYKRNGIDQTCFLMADGHKLHITRKHAKVYEKKRRGHYTMRCIYDQKAKVFYKCYLQK